MITFLASPKAFKGIAKEHQYRAIRSWQAAADDVEVILYGDSAGIDEAGSDLGVQVVKRVGCAPSGVPYFGTIAEHAARHGKHDLQLYLNCDVLLSGIVPVMRRIAFPQFLLIGQRIDMSEGVFVDVAQADWMAQLIQLASEGRVKLHSPTGVDYFGFRRGMWQALSRVVIGRAGYDHALLAYCMRNRIPIIDGTFAVTALHQFHGYDHIQGGLTVVTRGPDARHNFSQAGGARSATMVSDASYVVTDSHVSHRPCRGDRLRHLELKLRYQMDCPKTALTLRLIWRGLHALGITRVPEPSLAEIIDARASAQRQVSSAFTTNRQTPTLGSLQHHSGRPCLSTDPPSLVPTVAIITNVIPSYREGFYDRLFSRHDVLTTVYCQASIPGMNLRTIHNKYAARVQLVKALSAKGEALVWRFMPWRKILFGYDVVFVNGNPRVLSDAVAATLLRLFGRNVVLWTTGHSYRGNRLTERTRLVWSRIFDHIFVYTDAEVRYLRQNGFVGQDVTGMNNGLDQTKIDGVISGWDEPRLEAWRKVNNLNDRTIVLSCARLDPKNKFDQVIDALPAIARRVPDVMWCVIGTGPEQVRLTSLASDAGLASRVRFVGEVYDEGELAPWFLSATLLVHPGAIGLSLLHAFGYGLPVVTHDNAERHNPEIAAFEEELTGRTFRENDTQDLAGAITGLLQDGSARISMKQYAHNIAKNNYNVDVMVERFVAMAKRAAKAQKCDAQ